MRYIYLCVCAQVLVCGRDAASVTTGRGSSQLSPSSRLSLWVYHVAASRLYVPSPVHFSIPSSPPHVSVSLLTVFGCGPVWILNSLLCPLAIRFDFVWFGFVRNRERERQRVIVCCRLYVSDWPFKNSQRDCERTWHLNICEPIHYCLCSVFCFHYQYLHKPSYSTINTSAKKYSCFCRDCWLIYEAQVITYLIAEAL